MHVRDGAIQVVNHGGDMNLGGKLIDWEVVEQIFVPALSSFSLSNFYRGNDKWRAAFGKLKLHAEKAKIALTRDPTARSLASSFVLMIPESLFCST